MARANKHGSLHKVWEITALKRQPDHDKALAMLQRVAAHVRACDVPPVACTSLLVSVGITVCGWPLQVQPIMEKRKWRVGCLAAGERVPAVARIMATAQLDAHLSLPRRCAAAMRTTTGHQAV